MTGMRTGTRTGTRVEAETEGQMQRHYSRRWNTVVIGSGKVHRIYCIKILMIFFGIFSLCEQK